MPKKLKGGRRGAQRRREARLVEAQLSGERIAHCADCGYDYAVGDKDEDHSLTYPPRAEHAITFALNKIGICNKKFTLYRTKSNTPDVLCRCGHSELSHETGNGATTCRGAGEVQVDTGKTVRETIHSRRRHTRVVWETHPKCPCMAIRPMYIRPPVKGK
jgi:hypothetical protein